MALILLRHAPPPVDYRNRYWGHTDIPIDDLAFDTSAMHSFSQHPIDLVYSSDLSRCTRTLEALGFQDFIADPRLREVRFKNGFEGKTFDEITAMPGYSPSLLESEEAWHDFVCDESRSLFTSRIREFLDTLPPAHNILICTHAGTIRMIASLLGSPLSSVLGYLEPVVI